MANECHDTIIAQVNNLDIANNIRSRLLKNFNKLWIYVIKNADSTVSVSVANQWSGAVSANKLQQINDCVADLISAPIKPSDQTIDSLSAQANLTLSE
jgi:hypothetical protein